MANQQNLKGKPILTTFSPQFSGIDHQRMRAITATSRFVHWRSIIEVFTLLENIFQNRHISDVPEDHLL